MLDAFEDEYWLRTFPLTTLSTRNDDLNRASPNCSTLKGVNSTMQSWMITLPEEEQHTDHLRHRFDIIRVVKNVLLGLTLNESDEKIWILFYQSQEEYSFRTKVIMLSHHSSAKTEVHPSSIISHVLHISFIGTPWHRNNPDHSPISALAVGTCCCCC